MYIRAHKASSTCAINISTVGCRGVSTADIRYRIRGPLFKARNDRINNFRSRSPIYFPQLYRPNKLSICKKVFMRGTERAWRASERRDEKSRRKRVFVPIGDVFFRKNVPARNKTLEGQSAGQ